MESIQPRVPRIPCVICGEEVIPLVNKAPLCRDCLVPQSKERRILEMLALRGIR